MANLITGGSGFIGAELVHMLVDRGEEVVVFDKVTNNRLNDIRHKIRVVVGDLNNWSEVFNTVKDHGVKAVYHLGAMLTFESEANPWGSFQANVIGTYNVLEAARLLDVTRLMFTSSIGTFGEGVSDLTDVTLQRPLTFYGMGKLYGEGLLRFYRRKFGLDCRSVRYPAVIGPGVTTPNHWHAPMVQHAVFGEAYECPVPESVAEAMIYFKDAARAADAVLQAPAEKIRMINYNVGATPVVSAKELESVLKTHIPGAVVTYSASPGYSRPPVNRWDDSCARSEWGWRPAYPTIDGIVADFIEEIKAHPERYRK